MTNEELNDMIYSDNPWERRTAAMNGYGLDILVHDKAPMVRAEVSRQGYRPDILVHDDYYLVRRGVAESGNCLDILINDDDADADVRRAVARTGYKARELLRDYDSEVRLIALDILLEKGEI